MRLKRRIVWDKDSHLYVPQFWLLWWHNCGTVESANGWTWPLGFFRKEDAEMYISTDGKHLVGSNQHYMETGVCPRS